MRRKVQIVCIAAAAVVAGGTLWAIASSDMLGRFGRSSPASTSEVSAEQRGVGGQTRSGEKVAAVSGPTAPGALRPTEPLAIEIARIDAGGYSVIGGRSPPNHRIVVLANGREIASTVATDEGQWAVVVTDGIAAGPLELSVSATPASGGPAVVSTARQLVVPPSSGTPLRVAEAPPVKVWAPPMAAGAQVPKSSPGKAAVVQAESRAKTATDKSGSDKQALETFAALVERARTDAATVAKGESAGANAPGAMPRLGLGATAASPDPATAPATVTAAAADPATRARKADARPDPAQVPIPVPITFDDR